MNRYSSCCFLHSAAHADPQSLIKLDRLEELGGHLHPRRPAHDRLEELEVIYILDDPPTICILDDPPTISTGCSDAGVTLYEGPTGFMPRLDAAE